jgi:ribA/ribD-fused uncharacterized protein
MIKKYTLEWLLSNPQKDFCLFWGADNKYGCFSQWYSSKFLDSGDRIYCSAEQYMMASKASLFKDKETFELIMSEPNPREIKKYGRMIKNFDENRWNEFKCDIVTAGNLHKFTQNENLAKILIETGDAVLVEASPYDKIWGIGLGPKDPDAKIPSKWKGENLLGFCLMEVRDFFKKEN